MEAAREGKRLGEVTDALADDFDTLSAAVARVRRAHRLLEADTFVDLLRIGALHGISPAELAVLLTRFTVARSLVPDAAATPESAERLIGMWGIAEAAPRRARYTPLSTLTAFAAHGLENDALLDAVRRRIAEICANHARGNGTVRALLYGAANALDLNVTSVTHSADRYLHAATVEDRLRLTYPDVVDGKPIARAFAPAPERLLIEENPLTPAHTGDVGRKHGELFSVLRRGFERQALQVVVTGVEDRTVGPMLVNRDEGHGVGFSGTVPSGVRLNFSEEGRVTIDGADVTSMCYAWRGACFADNTALRPADALFDGPNVAPERRARFAEASPAGAISADFVFPHAGESLPMPSIAVGETRFAFFIQQAHFSRLQSGPPERVERVEPRPFTGVFDGSALAPGPTEEGATAAVVGLAWHERVGFWANVWIPLRFVAHTPDDEEGRETLGQVALAVNRFRPAGVHVEVRFLDDRWVLGRGVISVAAASPVEGGGPGQGTELWSAPQE